MGHDYSKLPRLYTAAALAAQRPFALEEAQAHYFRAVLRQQEGDAFRVFNGCDGEFLAKITKLGKKENEALTLEKIKPQPPKSPELHLLFAPIKKQRMDFLVEKAVELGATGLHPVITDRCEIRKINEARLRAQIIEAAEQCERMDIPVLHGAMDLPRKLAALPANPVIWCTERLDAPLISSLKGAMNAFLIGPEGGFTDQEAALLGKTPGISPASLGDTIFRSETAAVFCLVSAVLKN